MARKRARELDISIGRFKTGRHNAITDVAGVRVGHVTVVEGDSVRTGVTAIVPHDRNVFKEKVPAAVHVINGYGKSLGLAQVEELGEIETPICLTNTLNIWRAADAMLDYMIRENPDGGSFNVVCGECNDGFLNDIKARAVTAEHVIEALDKAASGHVDEGCVGAGTGMRGFGFKAGIGTSSRVADVNGAEYTAGVLVLTNTGYAQELRVDGVPVGRLLQAEGEPEDKGSIMIIVATDAPVDSRQLTRLAKRAAFGLARAGGTAGHGSGDFVIAFAVPDAKSALLDDRSGADKLFVPVIEATEEAIINSLFMAEPTTGRDGHHMDAIPAERVKELVQERC
jgi:D-aminopeptidase